MKTRSRAQGPFITLVTECFQQLFIAYSPGFVEIGIVDLVVTQGLNIELTGMEVSMSAIFLTLRVEPEEVCQFKTTAILVDNFVAGQVALRNSSRYAHGMVA